MLLVLLAVSPPLLRSAHSDECPSTSEYCQGSGSQVDVDLILLQLPKVRSVVVHLKLERKPPWTIYHPNPELSRWDMPLVSISSALKSVGGNLAVHLDPMESQSPIPTVPVKICFAKAQHVKHYRLFASDGEAEAAEGEEPRCLVRASSNKKHSKLSCVIEAKDILRFQLALGNILRSNMDGLKTREKTTDERKKEREQKLAAKAAKVKKDPADGKAAPVSAAAGSKKQGGKKKGR
ncbi:unnamed protein product [Polarella glacialis]|uniref:Signal recognition particle 14 kDa protein n=1 Tax=Polarella glacialis TaxID=89957 RepID=A0A813KLV2_POLGL|nr:unnamed protein product [Polarella glacialis]